MDPIRDMVEKPYLRKDLPDLRPGDIVKVVTKLKEGDKERLQTFEGAIIRRRRGGTRATITVRKVSYGVGVERVYPLHSPVIERIEILERGSVRRARLYYLRGLTGKSAKLKGKKLKGLEQAVAPGETPQAPQEEETPPSE